MKIQHEPHHEQHTQLIQNDPRLKFNSPRLSLWWVLLIISMILTFITAGMFWYRFQSTHRTADEQAQEKPLIAGVQYVSPEPRIVTPFILNANIRYFGDVFWGRYIHDWSMASPLKYEYPFSQLSTFDKQPGEFWIANLECPLTDQVRSSAQQEASLTFTCRPEYLESAKKWFDGFTLANNHMNDMRDVDGYANTRMLLDRAQIQFAGHFDNAINDICSVFYIPAIPIFRDEDALDIEVGRAKPSRSEYVVPVAICAYHNVFRLPTKAEVEIIKPFAQRLPTVVFPHQGQEYVNRPDRLKIDQFRAYVDMGADAVIGGHPHAVQTTEVYQNKLIIYSLGNFIFDQQSSPNVTQSIVVQSAISVPYSDYLDRWQSRPCSTSALSCVQSISAPSIRPEPVMKYSMVAADNSGKLVKKSDAALSRVMQLSGWNALPSTLKTP